MRTAFIFETIDCQINFSNEEKGRYEERQQKFIAFHREELAHGSSCSELNALI